MYDVNVVKFDKVHKVSIYNSDEGSIVQITKDDPKKVAKAETKKAKDQNVVSHEIILDDEAKKIANYCKEKANIDDKETYQNTIDQYVQDTQKTENTRIYSPCKSLQPWTFLYM